MGIQNLAGLAIVNSVLVIYASLRFNHGNCSIEMDMFLSHLDGIPFLKTKTFDLRTTFLFAYRSKSILPRKNFYATSYFQRCGFTAVLQCGYRDVYIMITVLVLNFI